MTTTVPASAATPPGPAASERFEALARSPWAPVFAMATAFVLGVLRLGSKSLWLDEAVSARQTLLSWSDRWDYATSHDVNMSLHHALIAAWAELGESEAWLRSPSLAFTVATVGITYLLGRRLFTPTVAAIASLALAANPFVVAYSQEARGYTMAMFGAALSSLLLLRALEDPSPARVVPWVVVSALLPYAHFFGFLVLLAHAVVVLVLPRRSRARARLIAAFVAVGALGAPLALFIFGGGDRGQISWIEELSVVRLVGVFPRLAANDNLALATLAVVAAAGALVATYRTLREGGWRGAAFWPWAFVLTWLVLPILLAAAVSVAKPIFVARYFIVSSPALALALAGGLVALSRALRAPARVAAAGLLIAGTGWGLYEWYAEHPKENWRRATATVLAHAEDGDSIAFLPQSARHPFEWYSHRAGELPPDLHPAYPAIPWGPFLQGIDIPRLDSAAAEAVAEDADRLWLVARITANNRESGEVVRLRDALGAEHEEVKTWRYVDVRVTLYERS